MKILLRKKGTGLYLQDPWRWTAKLDEAFDFGNSQNAINFARAQIVTDVEVIAVLQDGGCIQSVAYQADTLLRVRESKTRSSSARPASPSSR